MECNERERSTHFLDKIITKENYPDNKMATQFQPTKIPIENYLRSLLNVINGFMTGVQKNGYVVEIHNKEEARRLLSFFNNEYFSHKHQLSSSSQEYFENLYETYLTSLVALDRIEELKIQQLITKDQQKKRDIVTQIEQLQKLIPQAFKDDTIPRPPSTFRPRRWFPFFTSRYSFRTPVQTRQQTVPPPTTTQKQQQRQKTVPPPTTTQKQQQRQKTVPPPTTTQKQQQGQIKTQQEQNIVRSFYKSGTQQGQQKQNKNQ